MVVIDDENAAFKAQALRLWDLYRCHRKTTNAAEEYAARVDRSANDPARIEKRKGIPAAMTVPRHRP